MTTKKNMYKRELITALQDWKTSTIRKPLLLRGARQVGKTTLVHHFAKKYTQYIYLNLEKKADAIHFIKYSDAQNILDTLLLANRLKPVSQATTLLFIDEIQELPDAIALLRYFYEDIPELHVIAAGSLLEHAMGKVSSFPVGRVQYMYLFPLHFQEYLQNNINYAEKNIFLNIKKFKNSSFTIFDLKKWKFKNTNMYFKIKNYKRQNKFNLFEDFKSSVKRRLISDRPICLMLSGGLDSSLILSCLKYLNKTKNITAYVGYINKKSNDFIYAKK